jgi:hypothetical protein
MRAILFKLLLFFIIILNLKGPLLAQAPLLNISMSDTAVEAVINEIRKQTDIDFIFNHEELARCPEVSISVTGETVENVLNQCLQNSGLTFEKVNNIIIITPVKKSKLRTGPGLPTQNIRGTVRDRDSRATLPFASIIVLNTDPVRGAITDIDGRFTIENLPVGRYTLIVSYVGYEDAEISEIQLGSAKEVVLSVEITERTESIGEVSISYKKGDPLNQMASVSSRSFSVEETKRYPASISDPARMAQVFAGVSGTDDATNEIVIRGNSPNWLLWRLEGVEIPSPNHFAEEGYSSGAVSILSANLMGTSDFYTGAFPAEYGNALSGVFDMKLRNGNSQKREYTFQAGLLGIDVSAEGPFSQAKKGSYLFNYRYSTFSLLNQFQVNLSENALPNYQDLSFKINLPSKKAGVFSIWGIGGMANNDEKYIPDTTAGENPLFGYRDFTRSGMYAVGLTHMIFPDEKSYLRTVISQSMGYSSENLENMDSLGVLQGTFFDELQSRAFRISTLYNRKISQQLTLRTGIILNHLNFNYYSWEAFGGDPTTFLNSTGTTQLYQGFLESKYTLNDRVLLVSGLHFAHFSLSRDHSLEPRLGLSVKLPHDQKLSFGFGLHSKHENLPVYFVEQQQPDGSIFMPNLSLKMTRSAHYIIGYEKMLRSDLQIKTEAYFQKITRLPVPTNPDKYWTPIFGGVNQGDTLSNIGEGRNMGVEITFQKFFTQGYYFLVTGSLFDSKYKPASGTWYNTRYNINHITNLVGGKEFNWNENKLVGVNCKLLWSGGKRLIPIDLPASIEKGEAVYLLDEIYSIKGKDYFRIDLGIKLHFFKERSEHTLSLDIQNVTNRRNVWAIDFHPESESIEDYPMAGIIPIFNYRVEF